MAQVRITAVNGRLQVQVENVRGPACEQTLAKALRLLGSSAADIEKTQEYYDLNSEELRNADRLG